ncbi:unnamed protein product [Brachionus calyciflorus]|uniref:Amidase domain-containing protein n=1 Tax=Brachionus calyciflorus TaxID=104777 RepID=A0A814C2H1_9BILA|nr:unnamed protein product [Brachionus calyciflorus]
MPAHKLAQKIRNRQITSEQLVRIFIKRIKEIQPLVNAMAEDRFEQAIEEAKEIDRVLSKQNIPENYSETNAPLLGVPYTCKESIWVKDMTNSSGLVSRKDFRAPQDSLVVTYMKKAGAILTCTTNIPEATASVESTNYVYGTTFNPYNLSRIAGGSSSGEGCLVSVCGSILGIGSDMAGSIRIPSCFNGVYGHKPTSHLISNDFQYPSFTGLQLDMLAVGPLCRYASDLKLIFKILCGPKFKDFDIDLKKLNFFYMKDLQGCAVVSELSNESRNALNKSIKFLETDLGVKIEEIKLKKFKFCYEMWSSLMCNGINNQEWLDYFTNEIQNPRTELIKSILGVQHEHILPLILFKLSGLSRVHHTEYYIKMLKDLKEEITEIIKDNGIILFPSYPTVAPYHNQTLLSNSMDFMYFGVFNILGVPVTQIPMGLNSQGLPTGIQLIANHNMDLLTIKLAEYFETNLIGWVPPF